MSDLFIGTLSGTSMDAVDAAVVRFSPAPTLVATHSHPLPAELRQQLLGLATPGDHEIDRLGVADVRLAHLIARTVNELLAKAGLPASAIRAIGSHGQTIRHRPSFATPFTLQIGDPNVIAVETGIPVVADVRRKDVALGGQGAPLVPAFHEGIFRVPGQDRVVVNIGGIANLTSLPGDPAAPVLGFDTGPGNTLLDRWSQRVLGEPMDRDGALAACGRVDPLLLEALRDDPFFALPAPKSTGPEYFSTVWLEPRLRRRSQGSSDADVQATLVALTATTIADSVRALPALRTPEVLLCGGGARNPRLVAALRTALPASSISPTDAMGVPGAWIEAMAFAWLAHRHVEGRTGNLPAVTGARRAAVLGAWFPPG
jgi:anhydro-N-acetylmuramic acid kinase